MWACSTCEGDFIHLPLTISHSRVLRVCLTPYCKCASQILQACLMSTAYPRRYCAYFIQGEAAGVSRETKSTNSAYTTFIFNDICQSHFSLVRLTAMVVTINEVSSYLCKILTLIMFRITPWMKLLWFCHTNSGQLFCNCPVFVIVLVPGLFCGGKPDETCCHSVVAIKWLKTQSVCSAGRNTTT